MSRKFDITTGIVGTLILLTVALNFFAAFRVPTIPPGVSLPTDVNQGSTISENSVWKYIIKEQRSCGINDDIDNLSFQKQAQQYLNSDATSECSIPPSTSCQNDKLSVVVLSEAGNLRTTFLSLLSFLSYDQSFLSDSPIVDVTLVTTMKEEELGKDPKYGQRILDWRKEGTVKLVPVTASFWDSVQKVNPLSESVIWFNGDVKKNWKLADIRKSHSIWRGNSNSMVARHVMQTNGECKIPELHNLVVPREFLCFLGHPLMESFRKRLQGSHLDIFKSSIVLFWSTLTRGKVLLPQEADTGAKTAIDLPGQITSFFGCACPKHLKFRTLQEDRSTTCGSSRAT